jgi:dienelactone hydrolase
MANAPVRISSGTTTIPGELHSPKVNGKTGLVIIAHGTDGFEDNTRGPWKTMIRGYAEQLEKLGFFALIPEYFAKTNTTAGGEAMEVMLQNRSAWASALADCAVYARTLPFVDPSRVALLGFSLGGHLCLHARAAAQPRALVEYFAPMLDGLGASGAVPHAQIHHGTKDLTPGTSFANAGAIEQVLAAERTAVTLFPYEGAGHGFAGQDAANRNADKLSKKRTLAFFEKHL